MSVQKVLQINVRLSEGGAAGVARTLAEEFTQRGIQNEFGYGYASGGKNSPLQAEYSGIRITPAVVAAANRASYSLIGRETRLSSPQKWAALLESIRTAEIVHLHAIHSYMLNTTALFRAIAAARKPVVWTMHDQWAFTGRCAQPGSCQRWKTGCSACPQLEAYPPAKFDHAAKRWQERRGQISRLQQAVPTAIVACADWLAAEARQSSLENISVVKNSVDSAFWQASQTLPARTPNSNRSRNLFICRDLRDEKKVDWDLLKQVSELPDQQLTIVGDNAPIDVVSATQIPAIFDRSDLAGLMHGQDRLIFTSLVDYFPLTIVEALTSGLEVYALDSPAAREFKNDPLLTIFSSSAAMLSALRLDVSLSKPLSARTGSNFFAPARMADEYIDVYERLLGAA